MSQNFKITVLIAAFVCVIIASNLLPFRCHPQRLPQNKITPSSSRETLPSAFRALPRPEQNLFRKVLKTNYTLVWMAPPEVNLVLRNIHGKQTYLEWGSGGSTLNFPRWVRNAVSIEHDEEWCSQMKEKLITHELRHIDYHCVPVKRGTAGWGLRSGFEEGTYHAFQQYVDEIANTGIQLFDFILVDGRARVDCAIKALSYISKDSVVVLHDSSRVWDDGRYRDVLLYYDLLDYVGGLDKQGLAIMRRKQKFQQLQGDHQSVQKILDQKYTSRNRTTPMG